MCYKTGELSGAVFRNIDKVCCQMIHESWVPCQMISICLSENAQIGGQPETRKKEYK